MNSAVTAPLALCPYCHRPTVPTEGIAPPERDGLLRWLGERPDPLVSPADELRLCQGCARLYDRRWWHGVSDRPPVHQAPCPSCGSRAALAPFVEPTRQLDARRRFLTLAHKSMCLYCDAHDAPDPAQVCLHCPVEPKLYLCTRCDGVAKWSEPDGQPYRAFELVG